MRPNARALHLRLSLIKERVSGKDTIEWSLAQVLDDANDIWLCRWTRALTI